MTARIRKFLSALGDTFWLVPALMVLVGVTAAFGFVGLDRSGTLDSFVLRTRWLYDGGGTGARTLLGAIASSTIGVAGTVFSITIAALSLAAGQMGPRLLRNFVRDRGNQMTLGTFLATFCYALIVLRSVRTQDEGPFVPHIALAVGILLAFVSVATLIYFVGHTARRINVETVVELVSADLAGALKRLTYEQPQPEPPEAAYWEEAEPVTDGRRGYLQQFDDTGLADWAAKNGTAIRLLVRPGHYVFPGATIGLAKPKIEGIEAAIRSATALGPQRVSSVDLEFAVRQLVEVAVRALSPGINDPHTAISVIDRLGASLCDLARVYLPTGVSIRNRQPVLVVPGFEYDGLVDTMFHMIRQSATKSPAVLIRIIEALSAAADCETDTARLETLQRHVDLVLSDAEAQIPSASDLADIRRRHEAFATIRRRGVAAFVAEGD